MHHFGPFGFLFPAVRKSKGRWPVATRHTNRLLERHNDLIKLPDRPAIKVNSSCPPHGRLGLHSLSPISGHPFRPLVFLSAPPSSSAWPSSSAPSTHPSLKLPIDPSCPSHSFNGTGYLVQQAKLQRSECSLIWQHHNQWIGTHLKIKSHLSIGWPENQEMSPLLEPVLADNWSFNFDSRRKTMKTREADKLLSLPLPKSKVASWELLPVPSSPVGESSGRYYRLLPSLPPTKATFLPPGH